MKSKYIFLLTCLGYQPIASKAQAEGYCTGGVFYDQDYSLEQIGLVKLNEDRNYTMGLGLYYSSDRLKNWLIYNPQDWLFQKLNPQLKGTVREFYSIMFANGSFTPDSLASAKPILNDRPYSSLTYLQTNAIYVNIYDRKHRMYNIGLSAGILGSNISKEAQTFIHTRMNDNDTKNPRTPRGWANQLSNGGAPSVLVTYQKSYLLTVEPLYERENNLHPKTQRIGGEWKAAWNTSLGWYNMVGGEISYRFGLIDPRNWTYLTNPLGSSNKAIPTASDYFYKKPRENELYFFSTLRTTLVGYNVLLSGQGGSDAVTIPNKWVRRGVLDGTAGLCISPTIGKRLVVNVKGKFNFRSPEFEAPGRKPRWHYWGGLELIVTRLH